MGNLCSYNSNKSHYIPIGEKNYCSISEGLDYPPYLEEKENNIFNFTHSIQEK